MNKKGELTINYIILFIIGLIVLILMIVIFRSQIGFIVEKLTDLVKNIFTPIEGISLEP